MIHLKSMKKYLSFGVTLKLISQKEVGEKIDDVRNLTFSVLHLSPFEKKLFFKRTQMQNMTIFISKTVLHSDLKGNKGYN